MGAPIGGRAELAKELRAGQMFTLAFGAIIGAGWLTVIGQSWLRQAGPMGAVLAFVGGGLIMMVVGLCYAEMATMVPASGGEMAFAYDVFGLRTCFAMGWLLVLVYIATTAFEAIAIAWILGAIFPGIQGPTLYLVRGDPVQLGTLLLGVGGTVLLTILNYRGVKSAATFQDFCTYALIVLSIVFISSSLLLGKVDNMRPLFVTGESGSALRGIMAVFVTTPFWYGGFNIVPQVMEEKAPGASARRAGQFIVLSVLVALVYYCLVIVAASMPIPWRQLLSLELPTAQVFRVAFRSEVLAQAVLWAGVFGIIDTMSPVFLAASRVLFALGRARIILPGMAHVHPRFGSPTAAVILVGIISAATIFLGRAMIVPFATVGAICFATGYLLTCLGVIRLRRTQPDRPRPYRMVGGVPMATLGVLGSLFVLFMAIYQPYADAAGRFPIEWTVLIGWIVLGAIFWALARKTRLSTNEAERRVLIVGPTRGSV